MGREQLAACQAAVSGEGSAEQVGSDWLVELLVQGRCAVCGHFGGFRHHGGSIREGYSCLDCGASLRYRHQASVLVERYSRAASMCLAQLVEEPEFGTLTIYEPGVIGPFREYLGRLPHYSTSYFWAEIASGVTHQGVQREDLQRLTFESETFDLVITSDILEHVRRPLEAFREIHRVLKPGAMHVFTVPLRWPLDERTVSRVDTSSDEDEHLLPPVYHGSPTEAEGSLVYTDFGVDLIELLRPLGFETSLVPGFRYNATFVSTRL